MSADREGPVDAALARARAAARRRGTPATSATSTKGTGRTRRRGPADADRSGLSGPGPDDRDPQLVGSVVRAVADERGWDTELRAGAVAGRWAELVGTEIAAHCRPERLSGGELVLVAETTAWATQLRLLAPRIVKTVTDQLGAGVVERIVVHGPAGPNWKKGPWRVVGRGPRDTYG
jgi:predicted nucleic acid-binding Zn ribbon protein